MTGAWFVYSYDMHAYPIALFETELEALRFVQKLGYGHVSFWEFNTEWNE